MDIKNIKVPEWITASIRRVGHQLDVVEVETGSPYSLTVLEWKKNYQCENFETIKTDSVTISVPDGYKIEVKKI